MKKIIVDKTEGIAEIIDRILNEPDTQVSLVIPKGSALGKSVSNFHLLKREAKSANREIVIESVDETILAFARESGLESSHPLWKGVRGSGGFSDIVSRKDQVTEPSSRRPSSDDDDEEDKDEEIAAEPEPEVQSPRRELNMAGKRSKKATPIIAKEYDEDDDESDEDRIEDEERDEKIEPMRSRFFSGEPDMDDDDSPRRISKGIVWGIVAVVVLAAIGVYAVSVFFNHADVSINFKQTPWSYQNNFTASKSAVGIDPSTNIIPAQVFTANKNITETFPASGSGNVSQKAQGTITIYNDYSAATQELVATTRFITPSGQIFRIVNTVTVPGETTNSAGKLIPASITVPIVADQAGPAGNIGPVAKLTIPGFQNDAAREAGFYGVITASTTGGFVGEHAIATAADVAAAKASTTALLNATLQGGFSGNYPNNFKILDGATQVSVGKLTVNTSTDANGNFTVFAQATLTAIGFDESALTEYLLSLAQAQEASSTFKTINLTYSAVTANFASGTVAFSLSAQGSLEPAFDPNQFASSIAGGSIADARTTIADLPNLADGEISVWPSWLWSIPSNTNKIHVTVN